MARTHIGAIVLIITFIISVTVQASQMGFLPLEKQLENVTVVLQVTITDVEKGNEYMTLKDGSQGPITSSYLISKGNVTNVLWGETEQKTVKMKRVWMVPIKYDETGKEIMHMSWIMTGSANDHDIEAGKEYLFSFGGIGEGQEILHPVRTDAVEDKDKIIEILENISKMPVGL